MQGLPTQTGLQSTDGSKVKVKKADGKLLTQAPTEMDLLAEILNTLQEIKEILGS